MSNCSRPAEGPKRYASKVVWIVWVICATGYVWLLAECRAVGRDIAADPDLLRYAGLPRSPEPIADAALLIVDSRWWRPVPCGSREPVRFGGTIINDQETTWCDVRAVGQAYDRRGQLVAKPVARCSSSRLKPGQRAECRGEFVPDAEVLWFFMDVAGVPEAVQQPSVPNGNTANGEK